MLTFLLALFFVLFNLALVGAGLVLLFVGGDTLVRSAVSIAARRHMSPLVIGTVLVGFGTSAPELFTTAQAAWSVKPGIAVGNVVGSNLFNLLIVFGLALRLAPPSARVPGLDFNVVVLLAATALFAFACIWGDLDRRIGIVFLVALYVYVHASLVRGRRGAPQKRSEPKAVRGKPAPWVKGIRNKRLRERARRLTIHLNTPSRKRDMQLLGGGILLLTIGSALLVQGASEIARRVGVSETWIGLTLVAYGTSLPELSATLAAARARHVEVALGNAVGSSIFNLLGILGVAALLRPVRVPEQIVQTDLWVLLLVSLVLTALVLSKNRQLTARVGNGLLIGYAVYFLWLVASLL